jgi:hypothetical protein
MGCSTLLVLDSKIQRARTWQHRERNFQICFMSFFLRYVPINCFQFYNYSFYVCCPIVYVLLSFLCVLCFCIVLCIVSPQAYSCLFSICLQFYLPLPPSLNPTAVNKYHILSYVDCNWLLWTFFFPYLPEPLCLYYILI